MPMQDHCLNEFPNFNNQGQLYEIPQTITEALNETYNFQKFMDCFADITVVKEV